MGRLRSQLAPPAHATPAKPRDWVTENGISALPAGRWRYGEPSLVVWGTVAGDLDTRRLRSGL